MPGHYLQLAHANQHPSVLRAVHRVVREVVGGLLAQGVLELVQQQAAGLEIALEITGIPGPVDSRDDVVERCT